MRYRETERGSELSSEHLNQSCHTTCIPVTSWLHPSGCCSSGHPSHSLYLAYSSRLFWIHQPVFTPLMSPLLNACFFHNNTWISIPLMDVQTPGAKFKSYGAGRREMDVCVHRFNVMRLLIFWQGKCWLKRWSASLPAWIPSEELISRGLWLRLLWGFF